VVAEQRAAAEGGTSGAHSVPKSPWFPGESRGILVRPSQLENLLFPATLRTESGRQRLLAMQKVEGSNPFSRFKKGLHLQAFLPGESLQCDCVTGQ
jgi:hypothetical protein